ncbi:hypothetical protein [Microbacterium sp. JZ31]|uniref:hypothetical protein n=1 Tax=Microbacterium sp. JZ31 TaxID=1906274 RepID=UPI0019338D8C|nr:hypothetical protein [Microbacterium sp. JZ31]
MSHPSRSTAMAVLIVVAILVSIAAVVFSGVLAVWLDPDDEAPAPVAGASLLAA